MGCSVAYLEITFNFMHIHLPYKPHVLINGPELWAAKHWIIIYLHVLAKLLFYLHSPSGLQQIIVLLAIDSSLLVGIISWKDYIMHFVTLTCRF